MYHKMYSWWYHACGKGEFLELKWNPGWLHTTASFGTYSPANLLGTPVHLRCSRDNGAMYKVMQLTGQRSRHQTPGRRNKCDLCGFYTTMAKKKKKTNMVQIGKRGYRGAENHLRMTLPGLDADRVQQQGTTSVSHDHQLPITVNTS